MRTAGSDRSGRPRAVSHAPQTFLAAGLDHPAEQVRLLVLDVLQHAAATEDGTRAWAASPLYPAAVRHLLEPSAAVAAQVERALAAACRHDAGRARLLDNDTVAALRQLAERDAVVQFRVYSLALAAAGAHPDAAARIFADGRLLPAPTALDAVDDPLTQLNVLETLEQLVVAPGAVAYLAQSGLAARMHDLLRAAAAAARQAEDAADPIQNLVFAKVLSFYGAVCVCVCARARAKGRAVGCRS